jgi:hypothetical protein
MLLQSHAFAFSTAKIFNFVFAVPIKKNSEGLSQSLQGKSHIKQSYVKTLVKHFVERTLYIRFHFFPTFHSLTCSVSNPYNDGENL